MVPKSKNTESLIINPGSNLDPESAAAGWFAKFGAATNPTATMSGASKRAIILRI
jgi:hypothetical protein